MSDKTDTILAAGIVCLIAIVGIGAIVYQANASTDSIIAFVKAVRKIEETRCPQCHRDWRPGEKEAYLEMKRRYRERKK